MIFIEILQLRAKFQTAMVSWSRFIWITNFSDHNITLRMQEIRSSNPSVGTRICDPNKPRARHHRKTDFVFQEVW